MARSKKKNSSSVSVNFKGVEGKRPRVKPGDYLGEVVEATREGGNKADYIKWVFDLDDGGKAWLNTSLSKNSLWNLKGLLEAFGEEVPDDEMDIDLEEMVGKRVALVIEDDEYDGKPTSKVVDFYPEEDFNGDSSEKSGKKAKKNKDKDEDEDTDGDDKKSREDIEGMDRDELEEFIKENDMSVDPDDYKKDKKLLAAVIEELEENDYFEKPKKADKKGKKAKKVEKMDGDDLDGLDQEELQEVIDKYSLDVDLDDIKSLKKMVKAVKDAMEEGGYLND